MMDAPNEQPKTLYWGKPVKGLYAKSQGVREALQAPSYPPYCNTGGYEESLKKNDLQEPTYLKLDQVTAVDWLRVTTNSLKDFQESMFYVERLLADADMQIHWSSKGLHGYDQSATVMIWKDNDYLTVGHLAFAETGRNTGGLLELTGAGCKVLQIEYPDRWLELYSVLVEHEWRISRVDVALDLAGDYAKAQGYTVPLLFKQAVNDGLFRSDKQRNPNMKQTYSTAGDWSALVVGNLTPEAYDPLRHCPAGLTAYIGNRKGSEDFFRIYEKGKELLGAQAEPDNVDRGWVRIEHEMSRKATGRVIPLDVMLQPDRYFCADRSDVRAILDALRQARAMAQAQAWQRAQFKREKHLMLSKKVHWARHTYGRLVRTLMDKGLTAQAIMELLQREAGLREFIFDLVLAPENHLEPVEVAA